MSTLTAQVQHQGSIATISLAGYLSSETAGVVIHSCPPLRLAMPRR